MRFINWFFGPASPPISRDNLTLRRAARIAELTRRNGWYR